MNILVVDDEPTHLKLARLVLASEGHHVTAANGAEAAIRIIHRTLPDVILLDLKLPGIDGLRFASQLRQDDRTRSIPIIAVTGYPDMFSNQAVRQAGCDACILKPIDTRTLAQQVARITHPSRHRQPREPLDNP